MLRVRELEAFYGASQALFGMELGIDAGEVVTLMGRNGMGKTTTVSAIMGLLPVSRGTVEFEGRRAERLPSFRIARLGLGLVPEGRQIFPNLSVRENLVAAAANRLGNAAPWTLARTFDFLPRLAERQRQNAGTLSGGEQQMLAIGRGLASSPKLLMLDEPSMGLAPFMADFIFERLAEIRRQTRVTVLLVEQRVAEAIEAADYGYVLEAGRVVLEGNHDALSANDRVRQAYLGM